MLRLALPAIALIALLGGCGSDEQPPDAVKAVTAAARDEVRAAQSVDPAAFPKPQGTSLEEFAQRFGPGGQAVAASSVFTPKKARLAFGLLDDDLHFVYGKTVVYLQRKGASKILGPFPAPADVLVTEPKYRSQQAASEKDPFAAVYAAEVPVPRPGVWNALAVSEISGRQVAALMSFQAVGAGADKIPAVGEPAPRVETDTPESLKGNTDLLDTRIPPALELTRESFADVVGKKPVALLFATPQLCQSRVCGPVVDEMLQLRARYGDRMTFIHQEVYVDNDPNKGLRKPMQAYRLPSEPWLFTVRADGTIAARLEGSIGLRAFEDAIKAAL
jgi:hypothetical protein